MPPDQRHTPDLTIAPIKAGDFKNFLVAVTRRAFNYCIIHVIGYPNDEAKHHA